MWRWLCGIRRSIRQHLQHQGPRASASGCDEKETKSENCISQFFKQHNDHDSQDKETNCKWWYHKPRWNSFDPCDTLGIIGWGAAVAIGIELSRFHSLVKERKKRYPYANHCILSQFSQLAGVVHALPHPVRRSVVARSNKKEEGSSVDGPKQASEDPLAKVMQDFQNVCNKYMGVAKNLHGQRKAKKGQMEEAINSWTEASELGYSKATFNLAVCYETGNGVEKDLKKAASFYAMAAEEGHTQAEYNLALMYAEGTGVTQNSEAAVKLMEKAADKGLVQAQTYLGVHYTSQKTKDMEKAVSYFTEAARQNHSEAKYFLGICYEQGWGVDENTCKAADLYSQAAAAGHDGATYNLAVFHEHGLGGLPEDMVSAEELYRKAAELGNTSAEDRLMEIEAKRVVKPWKGNYPPCKMDTFIADTEQTVCLNYNTPTIPTEEEKTAVLERSRSDSDPNKTVLSMSSSSPSLTDFVREHLEELRVGEYLTNLDKSIESQIIRSASLLGWQPQFGSPKISASPPPSPRVTFTLGDDDDDIVSVNDFLAPDSVQFDIFETDTHHFSSMIQRNSTMPNLQTVSCI